MLKKYFIEPSAKTINGLEVVTEEYYQRRASSLPETGYIGPMIKGVDVGRLRFKDLHPDYPTYELCGIPVDYEDFDLGGYRVRLFCPRHLDKPLPVVFFVHGGGYTTGTIERYNKINRRLAELVEGIVVHVDYTLSPETGFPTALRQAYHAVEYMVKEHKRFLIDPEKVAIMGDSAGGHCCAGLGLEDLENRYIKTVVLYYPVVDMSDYSAAKFRPDFFGKNLSPLIEARIRHLVDLSEIRQFFLQNREDPSDELISPLLSTRLSGYPPTLLICAEYDFLTIQNEEFAEKLSAAGVDVDYYKFMGTFHGFLDRIGYFEACDLSLKIVGKHLRRVFASYSQD